MCAPKRSSGTTDSRRRACHPSAGRLYPSTLGWNIRLGVLVVDQVVWTSRSLPLILAVGSHAVLHRDSTNTFYQLLRGRSTTSTHTCWPDEASSRSLPEKPQVPWITNGRDIHRPESRRYTARAALL